MKTEYNVKKRQIEIKMTELEEYILLENMFQEYIESQDEIQILKKSIVLMFKILPVKCTYCFSPLELESLHLKEVFDDDRFSWKEVHETKSKRKLEISVSCKTCKKYREGESNFAGYLFSVFEETTILDDTLESRPHYIFNDDKTQFIKNPDIYKED